MLVGYRYFDTCGILPQFPFGHGLSYSKFEYFDVESETDGNTLDISFDVKNESKIDGKEVSQVYVRALSSYVARPYKELKGFAKIFVKAGTTERVKVTLDKSAFEYWSTAKDRWDIEDGAYEILVGVSAQDIRLKTKVKIIGSRFFIGK